MGRILADLYVKDVQKSLAFYRDVLGFEVRGEWTPDGQPTSWGYVALNDCEVMFGSLHSAYEGMYALAPEERAPLEQNRWGVGVTVYFRHAVPDVDAYCEQVKAAGGTIARGPETAPYGWRMFFVRDPDGYLLGFSNDAPTEG